MMKYKTGVLGLMLAGFLLFPVTADAAQEEIEIQPEGNQARVVIRLPENQKDSITSLQLGFKVDVMNGAADTDLSFEFSEEVDSIVREYRYNAQKQSLNLYVSGSGDLFDSENNELTLGTVNLNQAGEDTSAELTVRAGSFQLVNKAHEMIDTERFENFPSVTLGKKESGENPEKIDTTELAALVGQAEQLKLDQYKDGDAKNAFIQKLAEAQKLLKAPDSQASVDQVTKDLKAAMEALEKNEDTESGGNEDTEALKKLIESAEQIDLSLYEDGEIKNAFVQKLSEAKNLLQGTPSETELQQMQTELKAAIDALEEVKKGSGGRPQESEKEALEQLIAEAEKIDLSQYKDGDAKDIFVAKLSNAKALLEGDVSEEAAKQMRAELQAAMDALEKAEGGSGAQGDPSGSPTQNPSVPSPSPTGHPSDDPQGNDKTDGIDTHPVKNPSGTSGNGASKSETVKTGDNNMIGVWAGIFAAGGLSLVLLLAVRKKRNIHRR